jgi:predicted TIM-barrel fold metal-dependent hydrolase
MLIDCARHAGVRRHQDLFDYMPLDWRKHFDRYEWTGAVNLASNHIRVSDAFQHETVETYQPFEDPRSLTVVIPHQALTVNGWSDRTAAKVYVAALNAYGLEHWTSRSSKLAIVVSPHDPQWSAEEIRKYAASDRVAAVALPLIAEMLGTRHWDPIYQACVETGLPALTHYSGVEGSYSGAPPLSGSMHQSALARLILMPQLAESNIASLMFEGTFYRFPELQILFAGFGFKWAPSLMRRVDQEWRNFRSDVPWVKHKPSSVVLSNIWLSSYPLGEAADPDVWGGEFSEALKERIVFNSHAPYGSDTMADVESILGAEWASRMMQNGARLMRRSLKVEA